ncbi:MAG: M28 family peptidase [Cyclobacteriaceae bacterium]|nr:M28 family peptidase [Cyclobacteriaceae bacterium]
MKSYPNLALLSAIFSLSLFTCTPNAKDEKLILAWNVISEEAMHKNIKELSSDDFMGRAPSGVGEEKTIQFISKKWADLGVEPANGDSFFQSVPLAEIKSSLNSALVLKGNETSLSLIHREEFVGVSPRLQEEIEIKDSEVVFAGYGIVAPEYEWNDYKSLDVEGKTVVVLVNDPGFATQDPILFTGRRMTYYGRWTYKFEEAARQGASAILIIHETEPASYGWGVVERGMTGTRYDLNPEDGNASKCAFQGWLSMEGALKIFKEAGYDFENEKEKASKREFEAFSLGFTLSVSLKNQFRESISNNVAGIIRGSKKPDEYIYYMAHWDHLGFEESENQIKIFNGAQDNATGISGLIELARAFMALPEKPERSIVLLAVTAEERGLLGSKYYAEHPLFPLDKTIGGVNIDMLNVYGPTKDVVAVGHGLSDMDEYLAKALEFSNRSLSPEQRPEAGSFYRSDHFNFAKKGVPMLYLGTGIHHIEKGEEWLREQKRDFNANHYHKETDEYDPNWDLSGAVEDLKLLFHIGYLLSKADEFPQYHEGVPFRSARPYI